MDKIFYEAKSSCSLKSYRFGNNCTLVCNMRIFLIAVAILLGAAFQCEASLTLHSGNYTFNVQVYDNHYNDISSKANGSVYVGGPLANITVTASGYYSGNTMINVFPSITSYNVSVSLSPCRTSMSISTIAAENPVADRTDKKAVFSVDGDKKGGYYREINGKLGTQTIRLVLQKIPQYADINGMTVEINPNFSITGNTMDGQIKLMVVPEDLISNIDGINIQTGVIYHITGDLGSRRLALKIESESVIAEINGVKFETAVIKKITGEKPDRFSLNFTEVVETQESGGILFEKNRYNVLEGTDFEGRVEMKINGFRRGVTIDVGGTGTWDSVILILAMRPFLS